MDKIKISVPFNELIRKGEYREKIIKMLKMGGTPDTLNIQDDHPAIMFGPRVEETSDTEDVPPFYVSLKIHDMTLHNAMLDSGTSHNLMPKVIMDELGLDITRPYKDLFSFDSRKVKCLGLIKDLVVSLAQIPSKNMVMDVVVEDIPPKFGMLLSRSWAAKLKGTLQMDMSYTTIPIFGQDRWLYREVLLKYMVSSKTQPNNHPIYSVDTEVGSSIFYNDLSFEEEESTTIMTTDEETMRQEAECVDPKNCVENEIWNMSFDGTVSKEGAGVGVWISPPEVGTKLCSYKLAFECTNNMAEYEALILGLKVLKELGAKRIAVCGDSELIINQVKGIYQSKHPRLRAYINLALDLLEEFSEYDLSTIPREKNQITFDVLATSASVFKIPIFPNRKYEIEVKHRPTVPDNIKHWQVFEDDKQVERFLQMSDEFTNINIDDECCCDEDESVDVQ
jgi:ribonuclease HI